MDTNKMRDISREQFEKFALSAEGGLFAGLAKGEDGEYLNYAAQCYWLFWQASRAAVVVELPQVVAYEAGYDSIRDNEYAGLPDRLPDFDYDELFKLHRSDEVREAIEAQGLRVKP